MFGMLTAYLSPLDPRNHFGPAGSGTIEKTGKTVRQSVSDITHVDTVEDLSHYLGLNETLDMRELRAFIVLTIQEGKFVEARELVKEYVRYAVDGIRGKFSRSMIGIDLMKAIIYHQAGNSLGFKGYLREARQHMADDGLTEVESLLDDLLRSGHITNH